MPGESKRILYPTRITNPQLTYSYSTPNERCLPMLANVVISAGLVSWVMVFYTLGGIIADHIWKG